MLRLRTFGGICLERDGVVLAGRASQLRRFALLALLARAGARGLSRDKVIGLLWPEGDQDRGRHSLSQCLYSLRADLGPIVQATGMDLLRLDPAHITTDLAEFAAAVGRGDASAAARLRPGPFLEGFSAPDLPDYEAWARGEREQLDRTFADALADGASRASAAGDHAAAARLWRLRAALDPGDSSVALHLIRSLAAAGDREAAIGHAAAHHAALAALHALPPDDVVAALAAELALIPASRPRSSPRRRGIVLLAGAVLVVGALVTRAMMAGAHDGRDRAVVLGIAPMTDTVLRLAVGEELRMQLEGTGGIRVLGDAPMRETLRRMQQPPDAPLTAATLSEIAERRGADYVAAGVVQPGAGGTDLVLQVTDARSGAPLATVSEHADSGAATLAAIGRLARRLRRAMVRGPAADAGLLPAVTTRSLPALRSYARARQAYSRGDRDAAMESALAALSEDSTFAMAHYLVGELNWFADHQRSAESHLSSAMHYRAALPLREQLLIRARYEQLVEDRPDSSLHYWMLLRRGYADEPLAYEGIAWMYRGLGWYDRMAAAADTAIQLDSSALWPNVNHRLNGLIAVGDTGAALSAARALERLSPGAEGRVRAALSLARGEWGVALAALDSAYPPGTAGPLDFVAPRRQVLLLALGRTADAAAELRTIAGHPVAQALPRALLLQARAELADGAPPARGSELGTAAVDWLTAADISPAALARLSERAADVAARSGDVPLLRRIRAMIGQADRGRRLRSFELMRVALHAADAYAAGDMARAAELAHRAQYPTYFGRSIWTWILLEMDARARAGDQAGADSIRAAVRRGRAELDADGDVWVALRDRAVANRVRR